MTGLAFALALTRLAGRGRDATGALSFTSTFTGGSSESFAFARLLAFTRDVAGLTFAGGRAGSGGVGRELFAGSARFSIGGGLAGRTAAGRLAVARLSAGRAVCVRFGTRGLAGIAFAIGCQTGSGGAGFILVGSCAGGAPRGLSGAVEAGLVAGLVGVGGHFVAELAGEVAEFTLSETGFGALVAEHGIGGSFDALLELIEGAADAGLFAAGLIDEAAAEELAGGA